MTLPQGDVAAAQALRPVIGPLHQRRSLGRLRHTERGADGIAVIGQGRLGQIGQSLTLGINGTNLILAQFAGPQFLYLFREPGEIPFAVGLIGQVLGEIEVQHIAANQHFFQFEAGKYTGAALKAHLQRVYYRIEIPCPGSLCQAGESHKRQNEGEKNPFHFFCLLKSQMITRTVLRVMLRASAARSQGSPLR